MRDALPVPVVIQVDYRLSSPGGRWMRAELKRTVRRPGRSGPRCGQPRAEVPILRTTARVVEPIGSPGPYGTRQCRNGVERIRKLG